MRGAMRLRGRRRASDRCHAYLIYPPSPCIITPRLTARVKYAPVVGGGGFCMPWWLKAGLESFYMRFVADIASTAVPLFVCLTIFSSDLCRAKVVGKMSAARGFAIPRLPRCGCKATDAAIDGAVTAGVSMRCCHAGASRFHLSSVDSRAAEWRCSERCCHPQCQGRFIYAQQGIYIDRDFCD